MGSEVANALSTELLSVDSLTPYAKNPRTGDVDAIKESLTVNGQYRAIVVRAGTNEVLAGNHTLAAAKALGWSELLCHVVDVDDEQAARIVLVDNRSNDLATYDQRSLIELLQSLPDTEGTGYSQDAVDELLGNLTVLEPGGDTDAGAVPTIPRTVPGDLYKLGDHRLLCGSSTVITDVERLMDEQQAEAMWTDPPYGVSYVGKTKDALVIANDGADGLGQLLRDAFTAALVALKPGAAVYCAGPAGPNTLIFTAVFAETFNFRQHLVWAKNTMVLGHSDYHYKHEPILFGYTNGYEGRRGRGGKGWYGDDSQVSVINVDKPARSAEHPTSKPVELVEHCLQNSSRAGHTIYEPFCGSGSTLIACENLKRKCYAMELDPAYCDVIVDRWERHTGQKAELLDA